MGCIDLQAIDLWFFTAPRSGDSVALLLLLQLPINLPPSSCLLWLLFD